MTIAIGLGIAKEYHVIAGCGSFILATPLAYDHPLSSIVQSIDSEEARGRGLGTRALLIGFAPSTNEESGRINTRQGETKRNAIGVW